VRVGKSENKISVGGEFRAKMLLKEGALEERTEFAYLPLQRYEIEGPV